MGEEEEPSREVNEQVEPVEVEGDVTDEQPVEKEAAGEEENGVDTDCSLKPEEVNEEVEPVLDEVEEDVTDNQSIKKKATGEEESGVDTESISKTEEEFGQDMKTEENSSQTVVNEVKPEDLDLRTDDKADTKNCDEVNPEDA